MLVFFLGYRQVTCTHNKHRTVHAYEREPPVCLSSCVENWRYSKRREQELKAQYPKSIERKRLIEIMRCNTSIKVSLQDGNSLNCPLLSVSFLCIYLFLILQFYMFNNMFQVSMKDEYTYL